MRLIRRYLQVLEAQGGRMGEQGVVRVMQTVDRDRIVDEVEPLLNRLGFIRFGSGGRELTDEGRRYIPMSRRTRGFCPNPFEPLTHWQIWDEPLGGSDLAKESVRGADLRNSSDR
jgi:hypothetical protein